MKTHFSCQSETNHECCFKKRLKVSESFAKSCQDVKKDARGAIVIVNNDPRHV